MEHEVFLLFVAAFYTIFLSRWHIQAEQICLQAKEGNRLDVWGFKLNVFRIPKYLILGSNLTWVYPIKMFGQFM